MFGIFGMVLVFIWCIVWDSRGGRQIIKSPVRFGE